MATQKYQKREGRILPNKGMDGTYNKDGTKHRINVKSAKSSRDLERQVEEILTAGRRTEDHPDR